MRRDGIGDANRPIVAWKQLCIAILDSFPPRVLPASPVVSRVFRTFVFSLSGRLLFLSLLCSGHGGHQSKGLCDGHDFGQSVHLQIALRAPLGCGDMS